jgi:outer membrane protein TolC
MPRISVPGILSLLALPVCCAQPLTLDDCIRLAGSAPSAVTSAQRDVDIARLEMRQARNAFLPTGEVLTGYTYNSPSRSDPSSFSFVALNGIHEYLGIGQAILELDTSGRLRAAVQKARADRDAAAAGLAIARRDLRRMVTAAYYRVLLTRRLVTVATDVLGEARSFEQRVQAMAKGGEAARADVVRASAEVAFLEQALSNAQLEADLANMDLAGFWTTDVSAPLSLADPFDRPPLIAEAAAGGPDLYRNRPEFSVLDAQRRALEADSRAIRAQRLPQASLVLQYGVDMNRINFNEHGGAALISLTVPVFDWFRTRDASDQVRFRASQVANQARIAEREFSRDYHNALARVNSISRQYAITQRQIQSAEENLRLSRLRYEGGEGAALEVVTAQTQVGQARGNYFTALANYFIAQSDLEVAAGR